MGRSAEYFASILSQIDSFPTEINWTDGEQQGRDGRTERTTRRCNPEKGGFIYLLRFGKFNFLPPQQHEPTSPVHKTSSETSQLMGKVSPLIPVRFPEKMRLQTARSADTVLAVTFEPDFSYNEMELSF